MLFARTPVEAAEIATRMSKGSSFEVWQDDQRLFEVLRPVRNSLRNFETSSEDQYGPKGRVA